MACVDKNGWTRRNRISIHLYFKDCILRNYTVVGPYISFHSSSIGDLKLPKTGLHAVPTNMEGLQDVRELKSSSGGGGRAILIELGSVVGFAQSLWYLLVKVIVDRISMNLVVLQLSSTL